MMPGLFHAQGRIGKLLPSQHSILCTGSESLSCSIKIRRIILWHPKIDRHAADN